MPRDVQYTEESSIDVQWMKNGHLVVMAIGDSIYQFTDPSDLSQLEASLRRAKKQAFAL